MTITELQLFQGLSAVAALAALFFCIGMIRARQARGGMTEALSKAQETLAVQTAQLDHARREAEMLEVAQDQVAELHRRESALATRLEEREQHLADLRERMENEFRSMSTKLVREAGDALLREASQTFEKQQAVARQDAQTYSRSVSDLLKPMRDTLTRYEDGLRDMRDHQKKAQGELSGQISALAESASAVQAEARNLGSALKAGPKTRGRWGETTLRNVVELAGLTEHTDFMEQVSVNDSDNNRKQPDMVVRLPGERLVAVDSKVSLNDWLDAASATSEAERVASLTAHGKCIWNHVQSLAMKDYANALKRDGAIDIVVMFLPGETFFTAAMEARPTLFQDAYEKGVLIATPTTLIAILRSIAHAWRQQRANDNARAVADLAGDLYESLRKTGAHLSDMGKALDKAVGSYNGLIGNMETRVLPRARRLSTLEMPNTEKPIDSAPLLDVTPREPSEKKGFDVPPALAS